MIEVFATTHVEFCITLFEDLLLQSTPKRFMNIFLKVLKYTQSAILLESLKDIQRTKHIVLKYQEKLWKIVQQQKISRLFDQQRKCAYTIMIIFIALKSIHISSTK